MGLKGQKGGIIILMALGLVAMIGITALMVDLSKIYTVQTGLQNVASLCSISAVKALITAPGDTSPDEKLDRIQQAVDLIASQNTIPFQDSPIQISAQDIMTGSYDFDRREFEKADISAIGVNAVRVFVRQGQGANPSTLLSLTKIFGHESVTLSANATSSVLPAAISIAFDNSASMTRDSYPLPTNCPGEKDPEWDEVNEKYFKSAAYGENDVKNCRNGVPQPLYSALFAVRPSLDKSHLFTTPLFRMAFSSFNKDVNDHVSFSLKIEDESRKAVKDKITQILDGWDDYAANNAYGCQNFSSNCPQFNQLEMPVSATSPNFNPNDDGHTNIALAIRNAVLWQLNNVTANYPLYRSVILITDGLPDCWSSFDPAKGSEAWFCDYSEKGFQLGRQATFYQLDFAIKRGYPVHTIYFDSANKSCSVTDPAYQFAEQISTQTKGMFRCAATPEEITTALNAIPAGLATVEIK